MFIASLIIFNFLIMIYIAFALAILFHLRKYRWPSDLNSASTTIFIIGSLLFIGLAFFFFVSIPWGTITEIVPDFNL
ncbi:MAG: hypothetical protein A2Y98_01465 [Candidatus Portnoybacteria bacterium RBG_19FT_COMBO_36_7]|uniref:Uncharacterized protein n=1 Tax=Candidatus Portnoybacteria bacterium RBG_19FT_COMBO_36_7 TaxID=1801992 RepID=A0A1G2F683_9BACT|nr:MAG: hypothetical protein A2Y98_01465 [Candidatus Portnoybacteria bacterium RBG_19FT_COMBO_36_7]